MNHIESADSWFAMRQLRNQMVLEYIEDPEFWPVRCNPGMSLFRLSPVQRSYGRRTHQARLDFAEVLSSNRVLASAVSPAPTFHLIRLQ